MKKIFIITLIIILGFIGYKTYNITKRKNIQNLIIVNAEFKNMPEVLPSNLISIKLYDTEQSKEIQPLINNSNMVLEKIFPAENTDYILEIKYGSQKITKHLHKTQGILHINFTLEPEKYVKDIGFISRIFSFLLFLTNMFIFLKYKNKIKFIFRIAFFILLAGNITNFIIFPNQNILNFIYLSIDILLLLNIGLHFYFESHNKKSKILSLIYMIILLISASLMAAMNNITLVQYLLPYNNIIALIIMTSMFFTNLIILVYFIKTVVKKIKYNPSAILKQEVFYFATVMFFIFILNLISSLPNQVFLRNIPVRVMEVSLLYWTFFFIINIELLLSLRKKYNNIVFYIFRFVIFSHILFIFSMYFKNIFIFASITLLTVVFQLLYFYILKNSAKDTFLKKISQKLRGIENINEFEKTLENEILKNFPLNNIKFKILCDDIEKDKYLSKEITDITAFKNEFKIPYRNFDFAILQKNEKNLYISLMMVELKNKSLLTENIFILSDLLEKLFYTINYVRILNMKKEIKEKNINNDIYELNEEKLIFIKKFATLISNYTDDKKIKTYAEAILESTGESGDKND